MAGGKIPVPHPTLLATTRARTTRTLPPHPALLHRYCHAPTYTFAAFPHTHLPHTSTPRHRQALFSHLWAWRVDRISTLSSRAFSPNLSFYLSKLMFCIARRMRLGTRADK